jgi:hypothetical protein
LKLIVQNKFKPLKLKIMGILRNIWNTLFGKSQKEETIEVLEVKEPKLKVVDKKKKEVAGAIYLGKEIKPKEEAKSLEEEKPVEKQKKKRTKRVIGQKTLSEIKEYLIKYGSLDVLTCEQIFDVKSLHNFIWQLRKDGLKIKTDKVGLHNELGQKIEVTNYRLIAKK